MRNKRKTKKLVIIPAHNEQENIGQVVTRIRELDKAADIVVIDDDSTDRTTRVARLAGAKVIRLSSNMGYGVALQAGYKYTFERGYDYLVQLDGDGQHDPVYIPELLRQVASEKTDMIIGSRFIKERTQNKPSLPKYKTGIPWCCCGRVNSVNDLSVTKIEQYGLGTGTK